MILFDDLIQAHFGPLNKDELSQMESYFEKDKLKRNELFTETGRICNRLSLVTSGILRVFALHDRKEITQWISTGPFLITDVAGFFLNQPSRWTIQAFTDVELYTITKTNYQKLCNDLPKWNEIEKRFLVKCFSMLEDRVFSHLSMTAEERYDVYFQQNKELFHTVPLQYIASVLGMSAETLSRIRRRKTGNS